jgi:hypothetical protein
MENFIIYNPTKVIFGKDVIKQLGNTIKEYGDKVLLVYGKNSIKQNGIYNQVINQLNNINIEVTEYSGIKSNPIIEDVYKATKLGKEQKINVILAVGGGSVIDSAKYISISIPYHGDSWDFISGEAKPKESIPLITILTLAATGSEMNKFAVVQNNKTKQKLGYRNTLMYPKVSFLDPQYTYSVPANYTAYGAVDTIAHALEAFFGKGDASLSDRFIIALIKEVMYYAPLAIKYPQNYDYRAALMYASTCALNESLFNGRAFGDWGVHSLGHDLSLLFDIPHGASLSIAYPAWLKFHKQIAKERILYLGKELFNINDVDETILNLENFFKSISAPTKLSDLNLNTNINKQEILNTYLQNNATGNNYILNKNAYIPLIQLMS